MTRAVALLLAAGGGLLVSAAPPAAPVLRVGAAKVDVTLSPAEMEGPFKSVADPIFVRAVVIDKGGTKAVLVVVDAPMMAPDVAADITRRIGEAVHVPAANVLLATSHTHNALRIDNQVNSIFLPGSPRFVVKVTAATLAAVRLADAALRPARVGSSAGQATLVANRNQWSEAQHRFVDGIDRTGNEPIDHRLGVIRFQGVDGRPIAYLLNYAIEPVTAQALAGQVSGDVPGATARYVEERAGGGAVALFTVGAAGSPRYRVRRDGGGAATGAREADPRRLIDAMATVLGEEALATAADMHDDAADPTLAGALRELVCPGKVTRPLNLPNQCAHAPGSALPPCDFKDTDAPPVTLGMGVLRIGDIALVAANANVTPALGRKLTQASPLANTWVVALTYGPMKYVVDDAAYPLNTYEATASTARQGCAERGFLDNARAMIAATDTRPH